MTRPAHVPLKFRQDAVVTPSSGNVFADMGLPDAAELYAHAKRMIAGRGRRSLTIEEIDEAIQLAADFRKPKRPAVLKGNVEAEAREPIRRRSRRKAT